MSDDTDDAEEVEEKEEAPKSKSASTKRIVGCWHPGRECTHCEHNAICVAPSKGQSQLSSAKERWARLKKGK